MQKRHKWNELSEKKIKMVEKCLMRMKTISSRVGSYFTRKLGKNYINSSMKVLYFLGK